MLSFQIAIAIILSMSLTYIITKDEDKTLRYVISVTTGLLTGLFFNVIFFHYFYLQSVYVLTILCVISILVTIYKMKNCSIKYKLLLSLIITNALMIGFIVFSSFYVVLRFLNHLPVLIQLLLVFGLISLNIFVKYLLAKKFEITTPTFVVVGGTILFTLFATSPNMVSNYSNTSDTSIDTIANRSIIINQYYVSEPVLVYDFEGYIIDFVELRDYCYILVVNDNSPKKHTVYSYHRENEELTILYVWDEYFSNDRIDTVSLEVFNNNLYALSQDGLHHITGTQVTDVFRTTTVDQNTQLLLYEEDNTLYFETNDSSYIVDDTTLTPTEHSILMDTMYAFSTHLDYYYIYFSNDDPYYFKYLYNSNMDIILDGSENEGNTRLTSHFIFWINTTITQRNFDSNIVEYSYDDSTYIVDPDRIVTVTNDNYIDYQFLITSRNENTSGIISSNLSFTPIHRNGKTYVPSIYGDSLSELQLRENVFNNMYLYLLNSNAYIALLVFLLPMNFDKDKFEHSLDYWTT